MADELCVCGHPYRQHNTDGRNDFGCDECGYAKCGAFREALCCPASKGWWWMQREKDGRVYLLYWDGEFIACSKDGTCVWSLARFLNFHGPARFVKLTETSPFPEAAQSGE